MKPGEELQQTLALERYEEQHGNIMENNGTPVAQDKHKSNTANVEEEREDVMDLPNIKRERDWGTLPNIKTEEDWDDIIKVD